MKFKKNKFKTYFNFEFIFSQVFLLCLVLFAFTISGFVKNISLIRNLPLFWEKPVLISTMPVDPGKLSRTSDAVKPKLSLPAQKQVIAKSGNPLCVGVTEPWKLVPDPSHEGLYVICNTTSEQMATAAELNIAQNSYRVSHGLNSLTINDGMCKIAAARAKEISTNFSHDGFESAVERSGITDKSSFGENIASGPLSAVHFIEWSWDKSPGHKANMLGDWSDGCAGVYGRYAVFNFAR